MNVRVDCDGDYARLLAAVRECQAEAARRTPMSPHRAREWARAVDLRSRAAAMVEGADGHRPDKAPQHVVASFQRRPR